MKISITIFLATIAGTLQLNAQQYEWTESVGGVYNDAVKAMATDQTGNIYYTGYFTEDFDFDGSDGIDIHSCAGSYDFFVVKKDANGNYLWTKTFGNVDSDRAFSIDLDSMGNIILGGSFQSTLDFDTGSGDATYTPVGSYDAFILKLDTNGNFMWVKTFGGEGSTVWPLSLKCDPYGNILNTGFYQNAAIDVDPGTDTSMAPFYGGAQDIYVQKLDFNGNFVWSASAGGIGTDRSHSLTVDANANCYIAGTFQDTVDFDTGSGENNQTANSDDGFLLKLDANGEYVNCVTTVGPSTEQFTSVMYSEATNELILGGYFHGTLDFDYGTGVDSKTATGTSDGFVQMLDLSLNHNWVQTIGGPNAIRTHAVAVDIAGNIFSTGRFSTSLDMDPGPGTDTRISNGIFDVFIQKLNPLGNYEWGITFGGDAMEEPDYLEIHHPGALYVSGSFNGSVDFDPYVSVDSISSLGVDDGFISKYTICTNTANTVTINACDSLTINNQTYTSSGLYIQTLTNIEGCDSILTIDLTITNPASPVGESMQTFCNTASIDDLNVTGTSVQWYYDSNGGTSISGSTPLINGITYYASQTIEECESATFLAVNVVINSVTDVTTSVSGSSITATNSNATYVWLDCNNNFSTIPEATAQTFIAPTSGSYAVQLTENNCVDTSACVSITVVGIDDILKEEIIGIYPNPTYGNVLIDLGQIEKYALITISDINGKIIRREKCVLKQIIDLVLEGPAGVYCATIETENKLSQIKLLKQ